MVILARNRLIFNKIKKKKNSLVINSLIKLFINALRTWVFVSIFHFSERGGFFYALAVVAKVR